MKTHMFKSSSKKLCGSAKSSSKTCFSFLDRRSKRKDCEWNSLNVLYECRLESRGTSRTWEVETNFKIHQSCLREQKSLQLENMLEHVFFDASQFDCEISTTALHACKKKYM